MSVVACASCVQRSLLAQRHGGGGAVGACNAPDMMAGGVCVYVRRGRSAAESEEIGRKRGRACVPVDGGEGRRAVTRCGKPGAVSVKAIAGWGSGHWPAPPSPCSWHVQKSVCGLSFDISILTKPSRRADSGLSDGPPLRHVVIISQIPLTTWPNLAPSCRPGSVWA